MLRLNLDRLRINRAGFMEELKKRNLGRACIHTAPRPSVLPRHVRVPSEDLPVAYGIHARSVAPIFSKMSGEDVQSVVDAVTL